MTIVCILNIVTSNFRFVGPEVCDHVFQYNLHRGSRISGLVLQTNSDPVREGLHRPKYW